MTLFNRTVLFACVLLYCIFYGSRKGTKGKISSKVTSITIQEKLGFF